MADSARLVNLIALTKDGEWGKAEPGNDLVEMTVIRGTDFADIRLGNLSDAPIRYIPSRVAERKTLAPSDILIETAGGTRDQPTGRTVFLKPRLFRQLDRPITCASFSRFLRVDPGLAHPEYVYWYLQYLYRTGEMAQHQVQHTGVARFQYTRFAETIQIPLPQPEEQRAIAHILGTLDDKIELNRKMAETLEAMARALFKSWFVDFDPVRAKAEGRKPVGMDAETAKLFPSEFVESELGLIPKGWTWGSLYDLATYVNGAAYRAFEPNDDRVGLPIIKIAELKAGVTSQTKFSDVSMPARYRLDTGDILFSWSGNPDTSIDTFIWSHGPAWLNQHIFRVSPHRKEERVFVLATLKYLRPVFAEIARNKQTTGLGHVTVGDMQRLMVVAPSNQILDAWNRSAGPIFDQLLKTTLESQTLASLRDGLLPRLLSGEIQAGGTI